MPSRNISQPADPGATVGIARLAQAIEELKPGAVEVVGGLDLVPALVARGVSITSADAPVGGEAALVVAAATDDEQVVERVTNARSGRVLFWRSDQGSLAALISVAACRGYFRAAEQPMIPGITCVLLTSGELPAVELVARYEAALADRPELDRELAELRHQVLTSRDFAIGAEAEIAHLQAERDRYKQALEAVYTSTSWLLIRRGIAPIGKRLKGIASRNR